MTADKYRITKDGEIHLHGPMPNSIETGWYLYGYDDAPTRRRIADALDCCIDSAEDQALVNRLRGGTSRRALRLCLRWLIRGSYA